MFCGNACIYRNQKCEKIYPKYFTFSACINRMTKGEIVRSNYMRSAKTHKLVHPRSILKFDLFVIRWRLGSDRWDFDWLCLGLMTRQPLSVILCRLPEKGRKGRKEIDEIVEEMKEEERGTGNEREETEEMKTFPSTRTCYRIASLAQL